jgi:predicted transcriptional regulator
VPTEAPFYGTGRPLQTSIALDDDCASRLDELARAAGVSANALAVAALHAGLPTAAEAARAVIVEERVSRAGIRAARIERNLRLPAHLRARVDDLTLAARDHLPRATRADLINAALRTGLPADTESAAQLVTSHARRVERSAAA